MPATRAERSALLSPQERVAALLSGRDAALACEELALRARGDLDHGRPREAALQLAIAVDAALAELEVWRGPGDWPLGWRSWRARGRSVETRPPTALQGGTVPA